MEYSGQKFIKLVANKTPPTTRRITPKVPVITFVKNKMDTIIAKSALTILSILPRFFFMIFNLKVKYNGRQRKFLKK